MKNDCKIPHPLNRQGTSQDERGHKALDKKYVKIDERNITDLIKQSAEYSRYIAYYHSEDPSVISSDWKKLFSEIYDFNTGSLKINSLDELKAGSDLSPHLALFIAFLQLYGIAVENLNELPQRHLKFFYEEVLQLKHKEASADKAVVFAEISKGYDSVQIKEKTELIAGKDALGRELRYKTVNEAIVNKASVGDLKTIFVKKKEEGEVINISTALKANTSDGIKEPIIKSPPSWITFGDTNKNPVEVGFGVWSPVLNMPEGKRIITISTGADFDPAIEGKLKIEYTSVKGWEQVDEGQYNVTTNSAETLKLVITILPEKPACIPYSKEIHRGELNVFDPVLKITLVKSEKNSYAYTLLNKMTFNKLNIKVNVAGFKSLILQNDNGEIDPSKPFFPFGNRPVKNFSKLVLGNPYAFNKYLTGFTLNAVKKSSTVNIALNDINILTRGEWSSLFTDKDTQQFEEIFKNDYSVEKDDLHYNSQTKNNFIRIINTDFDFDSMQVSYAQEFADFIGHKIISRNPDVPAPNPGPLQVPELESLTMDYTTEVKIFDENSQSGVFHIYPFGYDKNLADTSCIVPEFSNEGNLYIGISDLKKRQSVSIHFLMKESSGDPELKTLGIKWYYFKNNTPAEFEQTSIVKDTTNNFTNSGIITFAVPDDAFDECTILPFGYVWIYASCDINSKAYPEMINIRAQAFECEFSDNNNDPSHLLKPLDAQSISKFAVTPEGIKKIEQAYPSYDGKMPENDLSFNTRISELLRHKNRAINIWDYERMILEEFPGIYRVKCISHSKQDTEYFPGRVLLVVVPKLYDLDNQEVLKPCVSIGNREKVLKFISRYTSPFVKIEVINPVYEEIEVLCHVTFNDYVADKNFYSKKLNEDLKGFLAPWSSGIKRDLNFHGKFYKSQIINFIDERDYVNYISFLEVKKYSQNRVEVFDDLIAASSESVVLTSYNAHMIETNTKC